MSREPKPKAEAAHGSPGGERPQGSSDTERLEQVEEELRRTQDKYLRALAELDNAKKRQEREKTEFAKYAAETVIRRLLPTLDSLDQALVAVDRQQDPEAIIKGVHLIHRQLLGLLEQEGVKRIATIGEPYDPHQHEAVAECEAGDGQADNTIIEELRVGYQMHGQVLRPALVKVARRAPEPEGRANGGTPADEEAPPEPRSEMKE